MSISWTNSSPGFTFYQSGTSVVCTSTRGYIRVKDTSTPVKSGNWTVWATLEGSKSVQITPYNNTPMYADLFDLTYDGVTLSFTMSIPDNLLGKTCTVSFTARKNNYDGTSEESADSGYSFQISTVRPVNPSISWDSGTSLSAVDNGDGTLTATLSGGATIGGGATGTVYYRVWCDNTRENSDGSTAKSWTFAPTAYDTQVTIKVQAYFVYNGTTYTTSDNKTCTITVDSGDYFNYYDGTQWVQCKVFYYDGTNWVECRPYYYDGSNWVEISS